MEGSRRLTGVSVETEFCRGVIDFGNCRRAVTKNYSGRFKVVPLSADTSWHCAATDVDAKLHGLPLSVPLTVIPAGRKALLYQADYVAMLTLFNAELIRVFFQ